MGRTVFLFYQHEFLRSIISINLLEFFQLYIKARGLDHVRFDKIVDTTNGATINLNKLRQILSSLKMPTVIRSPVHLEVIVQIEGKTILFFFLNQQSFDSLTEGDSESLKPLIT